MHKIIIKLILTIIALGSFSSCAISPDAMVLLDRSIMSYERAFRWGEYSRAKSFHKNNPALSDFERRKLKLYRVTSYETLKNNTPNRFNAYILIEAKYHKVDQAIIRTFSFKQHWKRDEDSEIWYLDSPFPKFK
ncbi:MAG: hypothetical protein QM484_09455 [Woeseiaceae bacterium]